MMAEAIRRHWPEYVMEAAGLGLFMISACLVVSLLEYPRSSIRGMLPDAMVRRALVGVAMGLTAVAIIYSPWGRRSGAHLNPAVTLTFWRLGKVAPWDAAFYIVAQFAGGLAGVLAAGAWIGAPIADASVNYAVTVPGPNGPVVAFVAELAITFVLMSAVLAISNSRWQRFTGLACGALVAAYITLEAPLSGMSMNPARTLASAMPAGTFTAIWVYFTAPLIGMFLAADLYRGIRGRDRVRCAKLCHAGGARCIFRCGYADGTRMERPRTRWGAYIAAALPGLVLSSAVALWAPAGSAQPADGRIEARAVGPIGMTVSDVERSVAFYSRVLGFESISDVEATGPEYERLTGVSGARSRVARMKLGDEQLELTEFLTPRGRPIPADSASNDRWFQHIAIIVSDMDHAYAWLRAHHVAHVSPGPQRLPDWNPKAGGIRAFYFKDPDAHVLEILQFPEGKGDPRWQGRTDRLFLGVDHTAIVVRDTDSSLRFYRDLLGFRVVGESENWGPEQERLNNVSGARLRITTLRAPSGPGVELLEYRAPRGGRPAAADARTNDLAHWHTTIAIHDAAAGFSVARRRVESVSSEPARLPETILGFRAAVLARDPDRHSVLIVDR
jgi:MIP family channel proteins